MEPRLHSKVPESPRDHDKPHGPWTHTEESERKKGKFNSSVITYNTIETERRKSEKQKQRAQTLEAHKVAQEVSVFPIADEICVSYLILSHKREMLDSDIPLGVVIRETLDKDFIQMLENSVLLPLLHPDTPKTFVVPKSKKPFEKYSFVPDLKEVNETMALRKKLIQGIKNKIQQGENQKAEEERQYLHKKQVLQAAIDRAKSQLETKRSKETTAEKLSALSPLDLDAAVLAS